MTNFLNSDIDRMGCIEEFLRLRKITVARDEELGFGDQRAGQEYRCPLSSVGLISSNFSRDVIFADGLHLRQRLRHLQHFAPSAHQVDRLFVVSQHHDFNSLDGLKRQIGQNASAACQVASAFCLAFMIAHFSSALFLERC